MQGSVAQLAAFRRQCLWLNLFVSVGDGKVAWRMYILRSKHAVVLLSLLEHSCDCDEAAHERQQLL